MMVRKEDIKVSVIVPVYNSASNNRLANMLECLQKQTLREIEFVLVFDSPTDNSYAIACQIVGKDQRFVFLNNETNMHIGFSRNIGLDTSTGEYIAFADDDDMMVPDMYEKLYILAKKTNSDIVASPAIFCNNGCVSIEFFDAKSSDLQQYFVDRLVGEQSDSERKKDPYPYLWGNGNMWNKIFKRSLIIDRNIRFVDTKQCCFEDVLFQLELFCQTNKIACDTTPYYTHIYYGDKSNTSTTDEYNSGLNKCHFLSKLIELYERFPRFINKKRVEKRTLDMLITLLSGGNTISKIKKTLDCFDGIRLYRVISWYPSFLRENEIKVQIYYLIYVYIIKIYLRIKHGISICSVR